MNIAYTVDTKYIHGCAHLISCIQYQDKQLKFNIYTD